MDPAVERAVSDYDAALRLARSAQEDLRFASEQFITAERQQKDAQRRASVAMEAVDRTGGVLNAVLGGRPETPYR